MKSSIQVLVTDTAVVVLSGGVFMTSIPMRHWTTTDGTTRSRRERRAHEINWLITRLTSSLHNRGSDSVMKRILRVMAESPPLRTADRYSVSQTDDRRDPEAMYQKARERLHKSLRARPVSFKLSALRSGHSGSSALMRRVADFL